MTRKRTWTAVTALGLAILAAWWLRARRPEIAASGEASVQSEVARPPMFVTPPGAAAKNQPTVVIDELTLDKQEVCRGEENFVNVKAHTTNGSDPHLRIVLPAFDGAGPRIAFRINNEWSDDAPPEVAVFGAGGASAFAVLPKVRVKDCDELRTVLINAHALPNTQAQYALTATVIEKPPAAGGTPFLPKSFEWTFGDGSVEVTGVPRVEHSFEERPMNRRFSYFLVSVKVRDGEGRTAHGSHSFELMNRAFDALEQKGIVMLSAQLTPRLPELGSDGVVRQTVQLFHGHDEPVRLMRVRVLDYRRGPDGQEAVDEQEHDAGYVLGFATLDPREKRNTVQSLDTNASPDVTIRSFDILGETPSHRVVRGHFSVMVPPPPPTKDSPKVLDPRLEAEILEARRILGKPFVTDGDLNRLRQEGHFNDLAVASSDGPEVEPTRQAAARKRHAPAPAGP